MQISLDPKADALYIKITSGKIHKTVPHNSYLVDVDKKGVVVGIEVLNYSKVVPAKTGKLSVSIGGQKISLPPA